MFAMLRRTLPAAALLALAAAPALHAQQHRGRTDRVLAVNEAGAQILVSDTVAIMAPLHIFVHEQNRTGTVHMTIGAVKRLGVRGDEAFIAVPATLVELDPRTGRRSTVRGEMTFTARFASDGWRIVAQEWTRQRQQFGD